MNSQRGVYLIEFICILVHFFAQFPPVRNSFPMEKAYIPEESVHSTKFRGIFWKIPPGGNDAEKRHHLSSNSFSNLSRGLKSDGWIFPIPDADSIHEQSLKLFSSWDRDPVLHKSNNSKVSTRENESQIAEVFIGVAYGSSSTESPRNIAANNDTEMKGRGRKYFSLVQPSVSPYKQAYHEDVLRMDSERKSKNSYLIQQPNRIQKSLNIFKEKPESLVREIPSQKINFSLPQLFVSTEEMNSLESSDFPPGMKISHPQRKNDTNHNNSSSHDNKKQNNVLMHKTGLNSTNSRISISHGENASSSKANFTNDSESLNWSLTRFSYPYAWMYHDHLVLIMFSLLSLFPLVILLRLHFMKKDHITPRYCSLLIVQLLIVCIIRVVLYSVDPFAVRGRFPYTVVSILNDIIQSMLICSVGIFLVILMFPVYRPKSQVFPRLITSALLLLFIFKSGLYIFLTLKQEKKLLTIVRTFISSVNFGENGTVAIGYIFLNLCTRQRHKIWWIRIYKKSLISSSNYSFSVLYSKLKQSIRYGSCAAFIQLFITFMAIIGDFDLKVIYLSLYSSPRLIWVEESSKRLFEMLVCLFLMLGVNLLFAPKIRSVIKKRSTFKTFMDIIKGRRRSKSKCFIGRKRHSLNIFTLNRNRKTPDYVATDFQLVWSQNRTLPLSSISDKERRKSARSLDFVESSLSSFEKSEKAKLSHSVDILNNIGAPKLPNSFALYDNLQGPKNQTPIYQNQYFHYNYNPKIHEPASVLSSTKKATPYFNESKKRSKKKMRPKSFVEDRTKINENYLTSYFSVLSMDRFVDTNFKEYATKIDNENKATSGNLPPISFEEINSPMISNEKWKDIKITPKFCTIKINSKNSKKKLASSKSVDLF